MINTNCKIGRVTHKKSGLVVHHGFAVNPDLVSALREELRLAESGEISSICFVSILPNGCIRTFRSCGNPHKTTDLFLATQILLGNFSH
jgi:hypothetical protein